MKIFICGQKSFGKAVMKALYEAGHEITGIAPPPQDKYKDKMVGYALLHGIPVVSDCDSLLSTDIPDGTELVVSAHSHWMISDKVLRKCKYGGIGFHPSLLPRHRGQDAVRWTVHMGDYISGGTVYKLDQRCDGGDILLQKAVWVKPGWDYHELWKNIFPVGVKMLCEAVGKVEKESGIFGEPQEEWAATWEPSWERPRLKRNELVAIGGATAAGEDQDSPCARCVLSCEFCTWNIADPAVYCKK